jgi:P27 family predicted phage terminase small subunit
MANNKSRIYDDNGISLDAPRTDGDRWTLITGKEKPPSYLNTWGKKLWRKYIVALKWRGIMTKLDLYPFEILCSSYGIYKEAEYSIFHDEQGNERTLDQYKESRNNDTTFMPELQCYNDFKRKVKKQAAQFYIKMIML